jgi:hypothetical protein
MSDNEKSTDPGLSAAKRREFRGHEAQEAIADHKKTQNTAGMKAIGEVRESDLFLRRSSERKVSNIVHSFFSGKNGTFCLTALLQCGRLFRIASPLARTAHPSDSST